MGSSDTPRLTLQPNPFRPQGRNTREIKAGTDLRAYLATLGDHTWVIRVNGRNLRADESHLVEPGDIILATPSPEDPISATIAIVAAIQATVTAVAGAVYATGVAIGSGLAAGASYLGTASGFTQFAAGLTKTQIGAFLGKAALTVGTSLLARRLAPDLPKQSSTPAANSFFAITGGQNSLRPMGIIPRHYGYLRTSPDLLTPFVSSISDDGVQSVKGTYCFGIGAYAISDIKNGTSALSSLAPKAQVLYNVLNADLPSDVLSSFRTNVFEQQVGANLKHGIAPHNTEQSFVATTSINAIGFALYLVFPQGVWAKGNNGKSARPRLQPTAYYRVAGTSDPWVQFYTETIETYNEHKIVRYIASPPGLSKGQYEVLVANFSGHPQWVKPTNRGGGGYHAVETGDAVFVSLKSFLEGEPWDDEFFADTTILGLEIEATSTANQAINRITAYTQSYLPYWDDVEQDWSDNLYGEAGLVLTQNPAWAFANELRETGVPEDLIDGPEISRWAAFCEANNWKFNWSLVEEMTLEESLDLIAQVGQAQRIKRDTVHSVIWDEERVAVDVFGANNIANLNVIYGAVEELHAVDVRFSNEAIEFQLDEMRIYLDGYDESTAEKIQTLDLVTGITSAEQVQRHVLRELARRRLRTRLYSWSAACEGLVHEIGDRVELAYEALLTATTTTTVLGYTESLGAITSFELSSPVKMVAGESYAIQVRTREPGPSGQGFGTLIAALDNPLAYGEQLFTSVTLTTPVAVPTYTDDDLNVLQDDLVGQIVHVGPSANKSVPVMIIEAAYDANHFTQFTAVDYAPQVFTADTDTTLPLHTPIGTASGAQDALKAPAVPVQAGDVRSEFVGSPTSDLPLVRLVVPIGPGGGIPGEFAATTKYEAQYRVSLDLAGTDVEEWTTLPSLEAGNQEIVVRDLRGFYLVDVRVWAISAQGNRSATPLLISDIPIYGQVLAPTNGRISRTFVTRTYGSLPVLRVEWDHQGQVEPYTQVRYQANGGPWVTAEPTAGTVYDIENAAPGVYRFELRSVDQTNQVSNPHEFTADYFAAASEQSVRPPTGLELLGPNGELLGSSREWEGRDVKIRWNKIRLDDIYSEAVDEVSEDGLIERHVVQVFDVLTNELLEEEELPINVNTYTYTYAKNEEDGLRRTLRMEVRLRDRLGRRSEAAVLVVSNTAPATPQNITVVNNLGTLHVRADRLDQEPTDFSGITVWVSQTSGFNVDDEGVEVYEGPLNIVAIAAIDGVTYYARAAYRDTFVKDATTDPNLLNISAQFSFTASGVIDTDNIAANATSELWEDINSTPFALFTGSDISTWKEIAEVTGVDVYGQPGGGDSPVQIGVQFDCYVKALISEGSGPLSGALVPGSNAQFFYRLVRDKGLGSEEIVYTSGGQTISSAGYVIAGATNPIDLVSSGTYTYTLEGKWEWDMYDEGTARFVDSGSGVRTTIEFSHTRVFDFFAGASRMEIRIPSIDSTWYTVTSLNSSSVVQLTSPPSGGTTSYAAYETRAKSTAQKPVIDVSQSRIQVREDKR